ncbi:MAG: DCC1-like thiol-disulfide oxidoreductase family protein [Crocinitomicaceae bacterium]
MKDIVFYDGACALCSRVVRFILKQEKEENLFFATLQGDFAQSFLPKKGLLEINMRTFYFVQNNQVFQKSSAALKLIPYLKWYFKIFLIFWIVPRFLRDSVYDFISKNRYRFFKDQCDIGVVDGGRLL